MAYREWRPADDLGGAVACLWSRTIGAGVGPVLPDGCTDVLWHSGRLDVAGPDTGPAPVALTPGTQVVGIRFRPGVAPAVFGVPAADLRDLRVPLAALWGTAATDRLAEDLAGVPGSAGARVGALERAVRDRLRAGPGVDPLVTGVLAGLRPHRPWPVGELAAELGLTERTLHRRCLTAFGYGAKTLDRVLRLQRLLALAGSGRPPAGGLAGLAAAAGYADQAHLTHECRALAGSTPRRLLAGLSDPDKTPLPGAA